MRVLVCGGREFCDYRLFKSVMVDNFDKTVPFIIQGGAKGADFLAKIWANEYGFESHEFPADWKVHGKAAGMIRNKQMLEEGKPDIVVAFEGGYGTASMIKLSKEAGIKVIEA